MGATARMAIHHPKQWPGRDLRRRSPILYRQDGAGGLVLAPGNADEPSVPFLVRLRSLNSLAKDLEDLPPVLSSMVSGHSFWQATSPQQPHHAPVEDRIQSGYL